MPSQPTSATRSAVSSKLRVVNGLLNAMSFQRARGCRAGVPENGVSASAAPSDVRWMNSRRLRMIGSI